MNVLQEQEVSLSIQNQPGRVQPQGVSLQVCGIDMVARGLGRPGDPTAETKLQPHQRSSSRLDPL